jgi:3-phenylpropionate/trans-cinnamate dioxygenase ferredoxin subunit
MKIPVGPADLAEAQMRSVAVGKRNLLIARSGGKYVALDDWCNHGGCLLTGGRIEGRLVICPCHEVGFELETGKNATSPGVCDDQPAYPVEEVDGQLFVEGFPRKA